MMDNQELLNLFDRINTGEATDEDIILYNRWCQSFQQRGEPVPNTRKVTIEMLSEIRRTIGTTRKMRRLGRWSRIAAACAIVVALSVGAYFLSSGPHPGQITASGTKEILPGNNKAVLTLANGQRIVLNDAHTGKLGMQGNTNVTKVDSGLLVYQGSPHGVQGITKKGGVNPSFNTLTIPRGGQYQLVLPDGTKVWLNSASSIRYPTAFEGGERLVAITGEVYFEVAQDPAHPFIVHTRNSNVIVLGTRFNVMAYDEDPAVTTTLLEGSVKVSVPGKQETAVLTPDHQASVSSAGSGIKVVKVDAANVAAWIHGLLSLKDCSMQEFMNQLSRWYDVDVEYAGTIPRHRFGGIINRNAPINDVLAALDAGGIHTKLEGRKIIVLSR